MLNFLYSLSSLCNLFHSNAGVVKWKLGWNTNVQNTKVSFYILFLCVCVSVYLCTLTHLAGNSSTRETACCCITVIVPPTPQALASLLWFYIRPGCEPICCQVWWHVSDFGEHTNRQKLLICLAVYIVQSYLIYVCLFQFHCFFVVRNYS